MLLLIILLLNLSPSEVYASNVPCADQFQVFLKGMVEQPLSEEAVVKREALLGEKLKAMSDDELQAKVEFYMSDRLKSHRYLPGMVKNRNVRTAKSLIRNFVSARNDANGALIYHYIRNLEASVKLKRSMVLSAIAKHAEPNAGMMASYLKDAPEVMTLKELESRLSLKPRRNRKPISSNQN